MNQTVTFEETFMPIGNESHINRFIGTILDQTIPMYSDSGNTFMTIVFDSSTVSVPRSNTNWNDNYYLAWQAELANAGNLINSKRAIEQVFEIVNASEIEIFLTKNEIVRSRLLFCFKAICDHFGNVIPKLEFSKDYEVPNWETLYISIPHQFEESEAYGRFNDLIKDWLILQPKEFRRLINITI
jgi:hypothetical protein